MTNPFEGKAIKFDTSEQLYHLAELARRYGLKIGNIVDDMTCGYFRILANISYDIYTNCYTANDLPEIHYSDFMMNIEAQKESKTVDNILMSHEVRDNKPDMVNHPPHYTVNGIEVIDVIENYKLNYRLGNVVKYVLRSDLKGNRLQDLKKAIWYLQREIQQSEKQN